MDPVRFDVVYVDITRTFICTYCSVYYSRIAFRCPGACFDIEQVDPVRFDVVYVDITRTFICTYYSVYYSRRKFISMYLHIYISV